MKRQWGAVMVTLAILTLTVIWVAESYHAREIESQKRLAVGELSTLRAELDGQITSSLVVIKAFQAEIALRPELTQENFNRLAATLVNAPLPLRHIALAPDLVVQFVYPLVNNETVIGFDYRSSPEQFRTVEKAINENTIVVTGPVELVQGGNALIARAAIKTKQAELWGMIAAVIDIEKLLNNVNFYEHAQYHFALRSHEAEKSAPQHIAGSEQIWQQNPVSMTMSVPGYRWQLAAVTHNGIWATRGIIYALILVGGFAITALIAAFMVSLIRAQRRLREAMSVIDHQARYDMVTQLPNRASFLTHLQSIVTRSRGFAVLFIDLDHFKEVNDTLGHDIGDELLQAVAKRLREGLRGSDFIARLGGDEFVIVLHDIEDTDEIEKIAGDLNQTLSEVFRLRQHHVQISASIGIAVYPEDGSNADALLKHADLAMYAAKSSGRRTYHFFNQELRLQTEYRKALKVELQKAIDNQQFEVHYQPIIDLKTLRVEKCEALIRWPRNGAWMSPDEFIPVAEKSGLIEPIGEFVFNRVCDDWLWLKQQGFELTLAINRSEQELHDIQQAIAWIAQLKQLGIPPQKIIFEITESLLMSGKQRQIEVIDYLREQGVKIALDDFGTGYSSISYLQKYSVDLIKIDRQFLQKAPDDQVQVALVSALLKVAQALGISTVAEGVETRQQMQLLEHSCCDFSQGYFISHPLPAEQLVEFIRGWETRR